jgi:hypothetical protein
VFARKQAFFRVDEEMCLEGFFNKEGFYTMSNFLKSLFGAKKAAKFTKSRMQTRRLELIGLEERITPAVTASGASGILALTTSLGEDLTSVVVNADGTLTVSATTAAGAPIAVTAGSGASSLQVGTSNAYIIAYTIGGGTADVTSISLVGDTVGNQDFTIAGMSIAGFAQANVGLTVNMGADAVGPDTLNFTTGTVTSAVTSVNGSGAGIAVNPTTGNVVVVNTGVTSLIAGSCIAVSAATGAVTITNTGIGTTYNIDASTVAGGANLNLTGSDATTDRQAGQSAYTGQTTCSNTAGQRCTG